MAFAHGNAPFDAYETAKWDAVDKAIAKTEIAVPIKTRRRAKEIVWLQRMVSGLARDAHEAREPQAAQALEAAEEALRDGYDYSIGRKR